jgi:hypothetical protein
VSTQDVFDLTWTGTPTSQRRTLCASLALYGHDWAAKRMSQGAGTSDLNWDEMVDALEVQCQAEGY